MGMRNQVVAVSLCLIYGICARAVAQDDFAAQQEKTAEAQQKLLDAQAAENTPEALHARIDELIAKNKKLRDQVSELQKANDEMIVAISQLRRQLASVTTSTSNVASVGSEAFSQDVLDRGEQERQHRLKECAQALADGKKAYQEIMYNNKLSNQERRDLVAALQKQIDEIKSCRDDLITLRGRYLPQIDRLEAGAVGMLVKDLHVFQVVDAHTLIVRHGEDDLIWIDDFDTSRLVDGAPLEINRPVKVIGTKQYATALNTTNTIFRVIIIDFPPAPADSGRSIPASSD